MAKNSSSIENSPTGSDYSLPCLSSDDAPPVGNGCDEAATSIDSNNLESGEIDASAATNYLMKDFESLPPSDIPSPSSPIIAPTSPEDTYAIRPFPLLHLMLSPSFSAIRDMGDAPGRLIDPKRVAKIILMYFTKHLTVWTSQHTLQHHILVHGMMQKVATAQYNIRSSRRTKYLITGVIVDPSTLCPWCDDILPHNPSEGLLSMIALARQRSVPSPRPGNCLGLKAAIPVFAAVCSAHEFENYEITIALAEGWPTDVDWRVFIQRVIALRGYLRRIIDDVDEDWQPVSNTDAIPAKHHQTPLMEDPQVLVDRPRKESVVWKRLINDIARRGRLHMAAPLEHYVNFDKCLPG